MTCLMTSMQFAATDDLLLMTAVHHNFTEIYTYDRHQTAAASAIGLKPVVA
jgi:hypothetical protein